MTTFPDIMKIEISRHTGELDDLRVRIVDFLRVHEIDEGVVSAIELSVYEAAANIIDHGHKDHRNRMIAVEISVGSVEVEVTMTYFDELFDLTRVPLPEVEEHYRSGKKRGLGIYFIRKLMDKVEYAHNEMISTLKMSKKI